MHLDTATPLPSLANMPHTGALRAMTTSELRAELGRSLEITAAHITRLALVWRELEYRGEDLSGLRSGLWAYMPLIASGRLRADLVVRYAGHSMLLRRLADLSDADQVRLLADDTVTVVEHKSGEFAERRMPITQLRAQQYAQVLSGGRIRPPEEQRRAAVGISHREPASRDKALAELAMQQPRRNKANRVTVAVSMSESERESLQTAATRGGVSVTQLVRAALIQAGLLEKRA